MEVVGLLTVVARWVAIVWLCMVYICYLKLLFLFQLICFQIDVSCFFNEGKSKGVSPNGPNLASKNKTLFI